MKGWKLRCTTLDAKEKGVGQEFKLMGYHLRMQRNATGNRLVFQTDKTFYIPMMEIAEGIASIQAVKDRKLSFWLGQQETLGVRGGHKVLIFNQTPGFSAFDYYPQAAGATAWGSSSMPSKKINFRAGKLDGECAVCRANRPQRDIRGCPELMPIKPKKTTLGSMTWWEV
jgi:hypothetical protein